MSDHDSSLFPDVLGYITGGARLNLGVIQAAAAARPAVVKPGQTFEVLLLAQNASDAGVELTATLHLPKEFATGNARLVAGVAPAEVGCLALAAGARLDAPDAAYKIGVEVEAKVVGKGKRVREAGSGGVHSLSFPPPARARIEPFRALEFSTAKRLARPILDAPVDVSSAGPGQSGNAQSGWVSLWTLADVADERVLLERYREIVRVKMLPYLNREHALEPLAEATLNRFNRAGFPLQPVEALLIAKVMTLILEYAVPKSSGQPALAAGIYNVAPLLAGTAQAMTMPRWFRALLRALGRDVRIAAHPAQAVARDLYAALLHDALDYGFMLVETTTGENVGSAQEKDAYARRLFEALDGKSALEFAYVYLPLVVVGIIINDQIAALHENVIETLRQMWTLLDERRAMCSESALPVLEMTDDAIQRALQTYGYRRRTI